MADLSPLRRRMIEDMSVRNLSPATQRSYVSAVSKFSRYCGRSPDKLGLDEVHDFQVHLVSKGVSWGSLNQIVCALRFFYGVTLNEATVPERIPYARTPRKLPVVLSTDEVVRFLEAVSSLESRAARFHNPHRSAHAIRAFFQSGFNEVAHSARPHPQPARPHRTLQIPMSLQM
jgi:Site-specific recombinase XerD